MCVLPLPVSVSFHTICTWTVIHHPLVHHPQPKTNIKQNYLAHLPITFLMLTSIFPLLIRLRSTPTTSNTCFLAYILECISGFYSHYLSRFPLHPNTPHVVLCRRQAHQNDMNASWPHFIFRKNFRLQAENRQIARTAKIRFKKTRSLRSTEYVNHTYIVLWLKHDHFCSGDEKFFVAVRLKGLIWENIFCCLNFHSHFFHIFLALW